MDGGVIVEATTDDTARLAMPTNSTYSPLYVCGDGWALNFRETPERRVIRHGRVPTVEEATRALAFTHMPALMALLIPIIAASVPESPSVRDGGAEA